MRRPIAGRAVSSPMSNQFRNVPRDHLRAARARDRQRVAPFRAKRPFRRRTAIVDHEVYDEFLPLRVVAARRVIATNDLRPRWRGQEDLHVIVRRRAVERLEFLAAERDADHVRGQALCLADHEVADLEFVTDPLDVGVSLKRGDDGLDPRLHVPTHLPSSSIAARARPAKVVAGGARVRQVLPGPAVPDPEQETSAFVKK